MSTTTFGLDELNAATVGIFRKAITDAAAALVADGTQTQLGHAAQILGALPHLTTASLVRVAAVVREEEFASRKAAFIAGLREHAARMTPDRRANLATILRAAATGDFTATSALAATFHATTDPFLKALTTLWALPTDTQRAAWNEMHEAVQPPVVAA